MKTTKKLLRTCLALLLVVFSLSSGMVVGAAGELKLAPRTLWAGSTENYLVYQNLSTSVYDNSQLLSVKSDNSKVIKVVIDEDEEGDLECGATLTAVKPGKAKITVTYEYKGEEHTLSATYTVKKAPKPFASIKIGGKALNLKKCPCNAKVKCRGGKKIKAEVKLKKGWKLKKMFQSDMEGESHKVKNGGSFRASDDVDLHIIVTNKKDTFEYVVVFESLD